jgi:hypothetical protein
VLKVVHEPMLYNEPIDAVLDGEDHVSSQGIRPSARQLRGGGEKVGQGTGWQEC